MCVHVCICLRVCVHDSLHACMCACKHYVWVYVNVPQVVCTNEDTGIPTFALITKGDYIGRAAGWGMRDGALG